MQSLPGGGLGATTIYIIKGLLKTFCLRIFSYHKKFLYLHYVKHTKN